MAEFETGLPSVRQIQGFIKEGEEVELKLVTQDLLSGQLRWQDPNCLSVSTLRMANDYLASCNCLLHQATER
jgi:host factor-I protein